MIGKFLTWQQLHERGILPWRQHTNRLIAKGIVPEPYRLGDPQRGRLTWLEADIDDYIRRKAAERGQPRLLVSESQEGTDAKVVPLKGRQPPAAVAEPPIILRRPTR